MRRLFRDGGAVKVSRSLKELSLKATRACEAFAIKHGRDPTISELAESLQVEPELAAEALNAAARPVSLSADEENGGGQLDIPIDAPEEKLTELLSLRQVIGELDERDRALIVLRFFKNFTQTQTARELSMSQVQVSRREKKILLLLREKLVV